MYASRPWPRRARLARDQPARLADELGGLRGAEALGQRRRRHVERGELRDEPLDARRVGPLVDAVERRHPATLAELGHLLVREDHQVLDQPVGLGLRDRAGADDGAVGVELELGLEGLDLEGRCARASPSAAAASRASAERLGDRARARPRGPAKISSSWS